MPRSKYTAEEKLSILTGLSKAGLSKKDYCRKYGIGLTAFRRWRDLYERDGISGLSEMRHWTRYSEETKLAAVNAYLDGQGGLSTIAQRYGLRSNKQLRDWIQKYQYNGTNKLTATPTRKVPTMSRKTTFEERVKIVEYTIAHNRDYNGSAAKFQVSYQQVRNWVLKSDKDGFEALIDGRGRTKSETEMTEIERLKLENRQLKAQAKANETAVEFAKKLQEIRNREG